jgi:hypothetical protein
MGSGSPDCLATADPKHHTSCQFQSDNNFFITQPSQGTTMTGAYTLAIPPPHPSLCTTHNLTKLHKQHMSTVEPTCSLVQYMHACKPSNGGGRPNPNNTAHHCHNSHSTTEKPHTRQPPTASHHQHLVHCQQCLHPTKWPTPHSSPCRRIPGAPVRGICVAKPPSKNEAAMAWEAWPQAMGETTLCQIHQKSVC